MASNHKGHRIGMYECKYTLEFIEQLLLFDLFHHSGKENKNKCEQKENNKQTQVIISIISQATLHT